MSKKIVFRGCYVAIATPFKADGGLDEAGLRSNVDFLIANGVSGIVPCGTTGESATLSWDEHRRVVKVVIEQVAGRVQVVAGAGSNNTIEAVEASKFAKEAGADAVMSITPYYNKPTQEGMYRHFEAVAKVDIPMLVYNVPGRTGVNMLPDTVKRLCDNLPQVQAIKEASGNIVQISEIRRQCGDRLAVLSGDDGMTLPVLACGGVGIVSVIGNVVPAKMSKLVDLYLKGDHAAALKLHEELLPLSQIVFIETNPVPVKACMKDLGIAAGPVRLPLTPMSEGNLEKLMAVWKTYK